MITEDTVSTATEATHLFHSDNGYNRRRVRSAEPAKAVKYQFERVYDMVASDAIVLCDAKGRALKGVGGRQLCRLLSQSVPSIAQGEASREVQLRSLEILRPNIDWPQIAIRPIRLPKNRNRLYVASVSESRFNGAGVEHASVGVKRILGLPAQEAIRPQRKLVTSRDRLAYDVSAAVRIGFHNFCTSPLSAQLQVSRFFGRPRGAYFKALDNILKPVDARLMREGMEIDRPGWLERFRRPERLEDGSQRYVFELPVRIAYTGHQRGTLVVALSVADKGFDIAHLPQSELFLA